MRVVDISEHQGEVNFDQLRQVVDGVIVRSSFGTLRADYQFSRNASEARRVGLPLGFYHYAYPQYNSPEDEADFFLSVVGGPQPGEILALDFEEPYANAVGWSLAFLNRIHARTGYKPLVYMNLALTRAHDWSPVVNADYGLWLAQWDYNADSNSAEVLWPFTAMRQYANNGAVPGIGGAVDLNIFYGDVNQFHAYGFQPAPAAPGPVEPPAPVPTPPVVAPPVVNPSPQPLPPTPFPTPSPTPQVNPPKDTKEPFDLSKYSKLLVALAGAIVLIASTVFGANDPITNATISILTTLGVYGAPNSK